MQTEVLQEFIAVAKHSSFRKAADELHISTTALSNHIAALEREVGVPLFERSGKTTLTPAGAHFYGQAQQMIKLYETSIRETREVATRDRPVIVQMFGQEYSCLEPFLMSVKTPFHVLPMDTKQTLFELLKSGEADVLASPGVPALFDHDESMARDGFVYFPIGVAELSFLMSSSNPLAAKDSLTREDVYSSEHLVVFGNLYDWFGLASPHLYGEDPGVTYVQDPSMPVGPDLVPLCDLGLRIMPCYRGAARHSCRSRSDLASVDKFEGRSYETTEYLVYRPDNPNPNVDAFAEELRTLVGDAQTNPQGRLSARAQV